MKLKYIAHFFTLKLAAASVHHHECQEKQPLKIETVNVASPKPGEVRFIIVNLNYEAKSRSESNWCLLLYVNLISGYGKEVTRVSLRPPATLHEGADVVESVGEGVQLEIGDHVVTCHVPHCAKCPMCKHPKVSGCYVR